MLNEPGRDAFRGREISTDERGLVCEGGGGGGRRDESRIGGSTSCAADERRGRRFGDVGVGESFSSDDAFSARERFVGVLFWSAGESVGAVACIGDGDRTMVFLQASHMPRVDVTGSLHVLQMATVVDSAMAS